MFSKKFLLIILTLFGSLQAVNTDYTSYYGCGSRYNNSCDDCCDRAPFVPRVDWCGWLEIGAEAFYWKPRAGFEHAFLRLGGLGTQQQQILNVQGTSNWAVRGFIGFKVADCGPFIKLSGLFFDSLHNQVRKRKVIPNIPTDDLVIPGLPIGVVDPLGFQKVIGTLYSSYGNADLRLGGCIYGNCWSRYCVYGNARYINIREIRSVTGITPVGTVEGGPKQVIKQTGTFEGVGPGGGITAEWGYCGFGLATRLGIMAIIGDRKSPWHEIRTGDCLSELQLIKRKRERTCVGALDFKIGVTMTVRTNCFQCGAEIGYEVNQYFHALAFRDMFIRGDQNQSRILSSVGFCGPYFRLSVSL